MIAESDGESANGKRQKKSAKVMSIAAGTKTEGDRLRKRRRITLGLEVDSAICQRDARSAKVGQTEMRTRSMPEGDACPKGSSNQQIARMAGGRRRRAPDLWRKDYRVVIARKTSGKELSPCETHTAQEGTHMDKNYPERLLSAKVRSAKVAVRRAQESALHHLSEESEFDGTATPYSERTDGDLITACGDLTWLKIYHFECDDYHYEQEHDLYEEVRGEIRVRASGYAAKGNLQDALCMYEASHRMETIFYRPFQFSLGSDVDVRSLPPVNPSELVDLHLRHGNFFQAELVLEESLILRDWFIEEFSLDEEDTELPVSCLIDLYKKFKARILADYADCRAEQIIMCRAARIDNLRLWKGLSLAGLIFPFSHADLSTAKKFKAPNLIQLILDENLHQEILLPGVASHCGLPLHMAVICNSPLELLRLLGEGIVHIDSKDMYRNTPLILAVCLGRTEMVRDLMRRGANTNARDSDNNTIFDLADQKMSQILLREMNLRLRESL
ncbi:hypothetical protein Q9189_003179 [Teloschistes chrysophthalmus]